MEYAQPLPSPTTTRDELDLTDLLGKYVRIGGTRYLLSRVGDNREGDMLTIELVRSGKTSGDRWPSDTRIREQQRSVRAERRTARMGRNPCEFILTGDTKDRDNPLVVRCWCMSSSTNKRYYRYLPLGRAATYEEAYSLWASHKQTKDAERSSQQV